MTVNSKDAGKWSICNVYVNRPLLRIELHTGSVASLHRGKPGRWSDTAVKMRQMATLENIYIYS